MREALKLALETFEELLLAPQDVAKEAQQAITAIKEALAQPEQEHDDLTIAYMSGYHEGKRAQRTWVGLTKHEHDEILITSFNKVHHAIKLTQDKLKEKNT